MAPQLNQDFRDAVDRVKTVLKRLSDSFVTSKLPFSPGEDTSPIDLQALTAIGVTVTSDPQGRLDQEKLDSRQPPPAFINTDSLRQAIQELLLENATNNVGINRGDMDAFAMQTQFLLDMQRYVSRKSVSRLERVVRASHRRAQLASAGGPLAQFTRHIEERFAASGDRK